MDRGAWQAIVHGVTKSQTQLSKITYLIYYNIASVLCFQFFGNEAYGILAPQPGIEPTPPALEGEILTTGPAGKSRKECFSCQESSTEQEDILKDGSMESGYYIERKPPGF